MVVAALVLGKKSGPVICNRLCWVCSNNVGTVAALFSAGAESKFV